MTTALHTVDTSETFVAAGVDSARHDGMVLRLTDGGFVWVTLDQAVVIGEAARAQRDLNARLAPGPSPLLSLEAFDSLPANVTPLRGRDAAEDGLR